MPVIVTKVTVEYEFEGKAFSVEFPAPAKLGAIVFSRTDGRRLQAMQKLETETEEIDDRSFDLGETFQGFVKAALADASIKSSAIDRSLWWHTAECVWFHPADDHL